NAQGHLPGVGRILVGIRPNELESNSPDQWPRHTAVPPEQGDKDELTGLDPEGIFRDDMANRKGYQDATEPPKCTGEYVGRVDDTLYRFSRVFDANFIVRQGFEIIPKGRSEKAVHDIGHNPSHHQRHVVRGHADEISWRDKAQHGRGLRPQAISAPS